MNPGKPNDIANICIIESNFFESLRELDSISQSEYQKSSQQQEKLLKDLILQGIEPDIALVALKSVWYTSVDRALRFLNDKDPADGKYEHPFINLNDMYCKICMEAKELHKNDQWLPQSDDVSSIVTKLRKSSAKTITRYSIVTTNTENAAVEFSRKHTIDSSIEDRDDFLMSGVQKCKKCNKHKEGDNLFTLNCMHPHCKECTKEDYQFYINSGEFQKLRCSELKCKQKASAEHILELFKDEPETLVKMDLQQLKLKF